MKTWFAIGIAALMSALGGNALAEWPERGLTLVTSNPRNPSWSQTEPDPRAEVLVSLVPRLSRELGVPVKLIFRPAGAGVLAGNMVAGAKPDGYTFGALGGDASMGRVIQEYTPYIWSEFVPVATAWRTVYALAARADDKAAALREMPGNNHENRPRLAHTGLNPIETPTFMAIEAARAAGFSWDLTEVDALNPDYLLAGEADAMVMPLGSLNAYPQRARLKVLAVFTNNKAAPCVAGLSTLADQDLDIKFNNPPFAFYLPSKANWRIRSRLSQAVNSALSQPNVVKAMNAACLEPFLEDIDGVSAVLNQEYERQETIMRSVGFEEEP